jgi:hypothetical protein
MSGQTDAMVRVNQIGRQNIKRCIHCGGRAESREDVWPEWLLERFRAPTAGLFGTVGEDTYADPKRRTVRLRCVRRPWGAVPT